MNVAIIGGGASGLVCAIEAARRGHQVCVFEKNAKLGRKILATGNGQCNISNLHLNPSRYHGEFPQFVTSILKRFDALTCKAYFRSLGLEMREGEEGRLYPMSHQASSVVDILVHEGRSLGVQFLCENEVEQIAQKGEQFSLHVKEAHRLFDACVIASGSLAYPNLGSSGSGYVFAKRLGHTVIEPYPTLVQLLSDEAHLSLANGVKVEAGVELFVGGTKKQWVQGDVLFTTYGLSGSAILDISRTASRACVENEPAWVVLDMLPKLSKEAVQSLLQKRLAYAGNKSLILWLEGIIPKKLALFLIHVNKLEHLTSASLLSPKELKKLSFSLKALRLHVKGTKGFESAEVSAGGVDVRELDEKTLMSKKVKNLYFCGEVLDIDGDCGGFNLHFAWGSGYVVGQSIKA